MPHSTSIWTSRRWLLPTAVVAAVIVVVGLVAGVHLTVTGWGTAPASSSGRPVTVHVVQGRKVAVPVMRSYRRPQVSWPAAVTATARITSTAATSAAPLAAGPSPGSAQAGSLPVWVGPPDKALSQISGHAVTAAFTGAAAVSRVQVSMAPHSAVTALGVHGAVFSIARADGSSAAGQVHVSVDYGSFAGAYGGGYASRLHLVELPACALTAPQVDACRKQTPLSSGSVDSVKTGRVGADVPLPGVTTAAAQAPANTTTLTAAVRPMATSSSVVVLAVTAAMSGSGGDYVAEPVSDATEWVNGGSSGAYTDSYPINVPPVPGGLEPTVALSYDSQATDGLTPVTNNQASWVGDGWDYSPGFIEQELAPCTSQAVGDDGTTSLTPVGDLCPAGKLTLSLDGTQSTMVQGTLGKETVYHAEGDDGGVITGTDPNMGLADGSYWVLAEPDGTDYYFGLKPVPRVRVRGSGD